MHINVTVTPELVERAVQRDSRHCMIAEAIKQQNPHFQSILVDLATIRWTNPKTGKRYVCLTPEAAANGLVRFDQGEPIEPFSFRLNVMQATPTKASGKPRGRKSITTHEGQLTITGGKPISPGHLRGTSDHRANDRAINREPVEPRDTDSNVKRSGSRYRQYGRRILQG